MKPGKSIGLAAAAAILATAISATVRADTLANFLAHGKFDAQLRAYYFRRDYATPSVPNASSFALAGIFNYQTARFLDGFSVGASYFTANALGTHETSTARIDTTLIGAANSINALGQAFIQYASHRAVVRIGDQLVATPWAGPSDGRVLPATYQAAYGKFTPAAGVTLHLLRILRYKGRTADNYFHDNNYYPPTWRGDANYGGLGNLPAGAPNTAGTLAFGADYQNGGLKSTVWYYHFYDFAHMLYGQGDYALSLQSPIEPFAGAQAVREWGESNVFVQTGTTLFGQPGTATGNLTLGLTIGVKGYGASLSLAYNRMRSQGAGVLGGGALISPYTTNFSSDPLYTSSMIRGLVELGPGSAWKLMATADALGKKLQLMASLARYRTAFNGNDTEIYFDVIYLPDGWFRGLSLRNRLEIGNGPVNPGRRYFLYNRVQLVYSF